MQLGFVSAILPELNLEDVFKNAADLKFDCVELMCWPPGKANRRYAGVTHIDVTSLDEAAVDAIHNLSWRYGITISGLGYYGNPLSADRQEAETAAAHVRQVIAACAKLHIPRMNTFIGRDWTANVDQNFERFSEVWSPLIRFAEEQDVRVGIENCPMLFTNDEWPGGKNLAASPAIWRRMFKEIPSPHFGLNYDPSHMVLQQMDEVRPITEFADRIFHVHAKDMLINREALNDVGTFALPSLYSDGRLPGRGQVNWPEFFKALRDINYAGPVCVEVEDREYEHSLQGRQQALRESCDFLRKYVPAV
ncbi:sugar phosphate isomerase/epimerase family protein [Planctomicrobium sp. SH661]|uniref:sugar phosphate isomerase/epimerase family protein n=1 Tax=Planctomicrobium sp. SH661 TaxID=3448124 RepID=UPI003F5BD1B3